MSTPSTFTDLMIVNAALTRMGTDELQNLEDDESKRATVMRKNYQQVKETTLTKTSWRFATVKAALNKLSDKPENRWEAAWQLPPDKLKVLFVYPPTRYEIQGTRIFANDTSSIEIDYIRYVEEGEWPPWFREYTIDSLLIATIKGITGEDPTTKQTDKVADSRSDALFQDSQQQPNIEQLPNPFIDCRY